MNKKDIELRILSLEARAEDLEYQIEAVMDAIEGLLKVATITSLNVNQIWQDIHGPA